MSRYDFNARRLFVDAPLAAGAEIVCTAAQTNYLKNVLRMQAGDHILVFNGRDGEWRADVAEVQKRAGRLIAKELTRAQEAGPDIDYLFAPLKRARLDYMVQKAVEMGAARLRPVLTRRTVVARVNLQRMRANAVEATEQCGILHLPEVLQPVKLEKAIADWGAQPGDGMAGRRLIFCDEGEQESDPIKVLSAVPRGPLAVLIGPEGGFDAEERDLLKSSPFVSRIGLGPRIMRADTAAVAALALVNAVLGDWR